MNKFHQNKSVIVLGMHRSGTSAISGVFANMGVFMGSSLFKAQKGVNDKGFFENSHIVEINESLFKKLESSWDDPLGVQKDILAFDLKTEELKAKKLLTREYSGKTFWGIKDPRTSVLMPFWLKVFNDLKIKPHYIIMVRHPYEVFRSLERRDGFSLEKSLILWVHYTLASFKNYSESEYTVLLYDNLMKDTEMCVRKFLVPVAPELLEKSGEAYAFISPDLRNHVNQYSVTSTDPINNIALSLYQEAVKPQIDEKAIAALHLEFDYYVQGLIGVVSEHLISVKKDETLYRSLFDEAYLSIWWKLVGPLRVMEKKIRKLIG
ncbi:sulfotransferase family protein [Paraglaciecola sp.]|uniref:sulfotransferase family protein n=1 Tax=Paraglaciecola sp. TaxID=1920173 RepID=UPI00273EDD6D|nr:hypothetical protein [Paraglaciecola sp.]MDP5030987.1 hypothetical protein [Paraglaciecola sp.]